LGANVVELHTGPYAEATGFLDSVIELERIAGAAALAKKLDLEVHAGHGLNYQNVRKICLIEEIEEVSIGHSIVARACLVGMKEAVTEMVRLVGR